MYPSACAISPPPSTADTHWLLDLPGKEPPFIAQLREKARWFCIDYACFPGRENNLIAKPDGALLTTVPVTGKQSFLGWLDKMNLGDLLNNPALDQTLHLKSWLRGTIEPVSEASSSSGPAAGEVPFHAFVSYDNSDWLEVKELAANLKKAGARLWIDKFELQPGLRWIAGIEKAIEEIPVTIVIIGKTGKVASQYQKMESEAFQQEIDSTVRRLIPVILEGAPDKLDLPSSLDTYNRVDFRQSDPNPFNQLLWGITGKRPSSDSEG